MLGFGNPLTHVVASESESGFGNIWGKNREIALV
jgi:hypothetical protein